MEEILFLTILIFFIINSLEYLLSIYFLVSLFNHKIIEEDQLLKQLIKGYKQVSASFSFHTIFFLTFIVTIFLNIYKFGLTLEEDDNDNSNDDSDENSNENPQNNNDNMSEISYNKNKIRLEYNNMEKNFNLENIEIQGNQNPKISEKKIKKIIKNANEGEFDRFFKINKIIMTISYLTCKFFYFLHLILISVNYNIIKKEIIEDIITDNINIEYQCNFILGMYKELMIVGYIFFIFFVISSVFAFIMSRQFLKCLNNLNLRKCKFLETYFDQFIKNTPEILQKKNKKMEEDIEKLKKYRDDLIINLKKININDNYQDISNNINSTSGRIFK